MHDTLKVVNMFFGFEEKCCLMEAHASLGFTASSLRTDAS